MLRATQVVLEEQLAKPILIGRPEVIRDRIKRFGLTIKAGDDFEIIDPERRSALSRLCRDLSRSRRAARA